MLPAVVFLPVYLLMFWFGEAPMAMLRYFGGVNRSFFRFFSVPVLLRTFFRPVKNEYRKDLIGFSIAMGIFLKSCIIVTSVLLFIPLFLIEIALLLGFLSFPLITLAVVLW